MRKSPKNLVELVTGPGIEQEVSSIQKLRHPNVVQLLGVSQIRQSDKTGCTQIRLLVFEDFSRGSSLAVHLDQGLPVDPATLRFYSACILEALAYMHSHNVVHRDLRETSLFLEGGPPAQVRVGDFSIDRRIRSDH